MLLSIFFPFLNFLIISLVGRLIGNRGVMAITLVNLIAMILMACFYLYISYSLDLFYYFDLGLWINTGLFEVRWIFLFDLLTLTMLMMVSIVSFLVHVYSYDYMKNDPHFNRFISYLSLFTFFMFILVTSSNFITLFIGWEGVGLCSFLLINFWFSRVQANKAAIKAMVMNRVGDIALLIAIVIIFYYFQTIDFLVLSLLLTSHNLCFSVDFGNTEFDLLNIICFFLFIAVMGKSAQLGLHTWLPSAMEGPTPVSALIHAATMVTAGIFLMLRVHSFFELALSVQNLIVLIGLATAVVSALTGGVLFDIKRIIAYSTCSQLGYMVFACGLGYYSVAFFHLINHAFFKALLFLAAGAVIHHYNNEQDVRRLNGLFVSSPLLVVVITIGTMALCAVVFFSGFYSKDLIIEYSYFNRYFFSSYLGSLIYLFILIMLFSTSDYASRLFDVFNDYSNEATRINFVKSYNEPFFIRIVLVVLMFFSIFFGFVGSAYFNLNGVFYNVVDLNLYTLITIEYEMLPYYIVFLPLLFNLSEDDEDEEVNFKTSNVLVGLSKIDYIILSVIGNNFYFNEFYSYIGSYIFYYARSFYMNFDKGILELFGPRTFSSGFFLISRFFNSFYTTHIREQLFLILITIVTYCYMLEFLF